MIPNHYHEILTSDYGDYMQLPPVEQQVSHHDFKLWKIIEEWIIFFVLEKSKIRSDKRCLREF